MPPVPVVISEGAFYRYELPLTAPLQLGDDEVTRRRGGLVRVETTEGHVGWGDAAPLPGFSPETLAEVEEHARTVLPQWMGKGLPDVQRKPLEEALRARPLDASAPPSLRFAMESAMVDLAAAARPGSVAEVLGTPRRTVTLNALLPRSVANGPAQAVRRQEEGYRALKVKVGQGGVEDDIDRVRAIRNALDDSVALRADANRTWSFDEALTFGRATEDLRISYVEEPLADPTRLNDLIEKTSLSVALDETTRETTPKVLFDGPNVSAVVLKPTLLGGLVKTKSWCRAAQETDATPVLSAAYESGVGLRMLVALAATGPEVPVGHSKRRLRGLLVGRPFEAGDEVVHLAGVRLREESPNLAGLDRLDVVGRGGVLPPLQGLAADALVVEVSLPLDAGHCPAVGTVVRDFDHTYCRGWKGIA